MEACLGLGRSQRLNKAQKELKQQQQQQQHLTQQQQHNPQQHAQQLSLQQQKLLQHQKLPIVSNQNYYTTQQQQQQQQQTPQHHNHIQQQQQQQQQRHILRGQQQQFQLQQITNVALLKTQNVVHGQQNVGQNANCATTPNVSLSMPAAASATTTTTTAATTTTTPKYQNNCMQFSSAASAKVKPPKTLPLPTHNETMASAASKAATAATAATRDADRLMALDRSLPGDRSSGSSGKSMQSHGKSTLTVEVVTNPPSSLSPTTNQPATSTALSLSSNVRSFRKLNNNRHPLSAHATHTHSGQQQHYHSHLSQHLHHQIETDLDAIEICNESDAVNNLKSSASRQTKTLGRLNHGNQQHQHHHNIEDPMQLHHQHQHQSSHMGHHTMGGQWPSAQSTSLQLLQLQQQQHQQHQHDYSYAYYEPGAAMRHTNIPGSELLAAEEDDDLLNPPPPNSMRALLSKGKKNKLLVSPATRQAYQARLTQQRSRDGGNGMAGGAAAAGCSNTSTPENFYEEISASSTSSSSNSMASHHQLRATSQSVGSLSQKLVEEEFRRVQNTHRKILGELNLSVEEMLMTDIPAHNGSPTSKEPPEPTVSVTSASGQPMRMNSSSVDNICDSTTLADIGQPEDLINPLPNSMSIGTGMLPTTCVGGDLDSGFSGSSGASYIGSLRLHKTNALMSSRSIAGLSNSKQKQKQQLQQQQQQQHSAFSYATQSCRSFQRSNSASCAGHNVLTANTTKQLPQIHQKKLSNQAGLYNCHNVSNMTAATMPHHFHANSMQSTAVNCGIAHGDDDDDDEPLNSNSFFTRASCGRRILNCAKIRAAEDPGPVVVQHESKAKSFWMRKGWRKFPGFSTSTSSINDAGLSPGK